EAQRTRRDIEFAGQVGNRVIVPHGRDRLRRLQWDRRQQCHGTYVKVNSGGADGAVIGARWSTSCLVRLRNAGPIAGTASGLLSLSDNNGSSSCCNSRTRLP